MDAKTFQSKARGDFYLYYRKSGSNQVTYLTGTRDLHKSHYIVDRMPKLALRSTNPDGSYAIVQDADGNVNVCPRGRITVWSWNSDKIRFIPLDRITKIIPLEVVLKNGRSG